MFRLLGLRGFSFLQDRETEAGKGKELSQKGQSELQYRMYLGPTI